MKVFLGATSDKEYLNILIKYNINRVLVFNFFKPYDNEKILFDNGAYSYYLNNVKFPKAKYLSRILKVNNKFKDNIAFMVYPDMVGLGDRSLEFTEYWINYLNEFCNKYMIDNYFKWKKYIVIQDNMTIEKTEKLLKKYNIDGIFIGGTDNFKYPVENSECMEFVNEFSDSYNFHVGRLSTIKLIDFWKDQNIKSFDTSFIYWIRKRFYDYIDHLIEVDII